MKFIKKISAKYSQKGLKGLYDSAVYHISNKITYFRTLNYFAIHQNLSEGLYDDILGWKSYLYLKNIYERTLNNLPKYQMADSPTKIIWWCWFQGEENAPNLCQCCLKSLRKYFPDYTINVVTEENLVSFVSIPDFVMGKYRKGCFSRTHFSDIIRAALLSEYGGIWIDSTVLCTGRHDFIEVQPLFVYQDWKFNRKLPTVASSWLISSFKGNPIISATRDLLYEYWKDNNTIVNYFLFHHFFHIATEFYAEEWKKLPRFSNLPPHYLQFELFDCYSEERFKQICQASDFHKLTYKDVRMKEGVSGSFYNKLFLND